MYIVNSRGEFVYSYRKHYLFADDKNWATAGPQFETLSVEGIGKVGLGICMDINTPDFSNWKEKYEEHTMHLANFFKSSSDHLKLIVLVANVPIAPNRKIEHHKPYFQQEHWLKRMKPLFGDDTLFCIANRVGCENNQYFCGSSCVIYLKDKKTLASANCTEEQVVLYNREHFQNGNSRHRRPSFEQQHRHHHDEQRRDHGNRSKHHSYEKKRDYEDSHREREAKRQHL